MTDWAGRMTPAECAVRDHYRAVAMLADVVDFVTREGGGVSAYTVACEMGWVESDPITELRLVYEVVLDLVGRGELRYVEHLLYPPENATVRILREVGWRGEVRVNGEPVDLG